MGVQFLQVYTSASSPAEFRLRMQVVKGNATSRPWGGLICGPGRQSARNRGEKVVLYIIRMQDGVVRVARPSSTREIFHLDTLNGDHAKIMVY
jgi:hypothetical protein